MRIIRNTTILFHRLGYDIKRQTNRSRPGPDDDTGMLPRTVTGRPENLYRWNLLLLLCVWLHASSSFRLGTSVSSRYVMFNAVWTRYWTHQPVTDRDVQEDLLSNGGLQVAPEGLCTVRCVEKCVELRSASCWTAELPCTAITSSELATLLISYHCGSTWALFKLFKCTNRVEHFYSDIKLHTSTHSHML